MFQETRVAFLYCISPVHMGTGTAVGGLIDNPIQRERHTEYPMMVGSGIKGAIRHDYWAQGNNEKYINILFGPDQSASDHAGALSFSDGQLVAFPVRCPTSGFVYATSNLLLARLKRHLVLSGLTVDWQIPELVSGSCIVTDEKLLVENHLALEAYELIASSSGELKDIATWLAKNALPDGKEYEYFRNKLESDLVLLPDDELHYFVVNSTVVEPHVRINDISGTAIDGGLFYTENLPPESLLFTVIMASQQRYKKSEVDSVCMGALEIINLLVEGKNNDDTNWLPLNHRMVQFGGDATTGRGQIVCSIVNLGGANE